MAIVVNQAQFSKTSRPSTSQASTLTLTGVSGTGGRGRRAAARRRDSLPAPDKSLAKAAFPAAGRQDGNSGKAQRTLLPIHGGAKYEDHNTRRSVHRSSLPAANRMLAEDRVSVNESQCDSTRMPCCPRIFGFAPCESLAPLTTTKCAGREAA